MKSAASAIGRSGAPATSLAHVAAPATTSVMTADREGARAMRRRVKVARRRIPVGCSRGLVSVEASEFQPARQDHGSPNVEHQLQAHHTGGAERSLNLPLTRFSVRVTGSPRQPQLERGAFCHDTLDGDIPTQQPGEAARDGETQASAPF